MIMPIVSVIVPTTHDRAAFNERIAKMFYAQDYPNKELLFDYEEGKVGTKRNRLCSKAIGDIIVHMDSDDLYAYDWISKSVNFLIESEKDITGLAKLHFYDPALPGIWRYDYPTDAEPWIAGATMAYWKNLWKANPFKDMQVGEDSGFVWSEKFPVKVFAHGYIDGFAAIIHPGNTSKKILANPRYTRLDEDAENILIEQLKMA